MKVFGSIGRRDVRALRTLVACAMIATVAAPARADQSIETAMAAADFTNSIGVNTHFQYDKPYRKDAAAVVALLGDSGIRHIRDAAMPFTDKTYIGILGMLNARGIKVDLLTDERIKVDYLVGQSRAFPAGMIESYENPNELDLGHPGDYYLNALRPFTPALYQALKANPSTSTLPVIGPSLTSEKACIAFAALNLDAYFDYGNIHNYVFPAPPGTSGSGPNHFGSIDYWMKAAGHYARAKPIVTTELGWGSSSRPHDVTELVQLKYLQRILFEQSLHGIKRTYLYQFLDSGIGFSTFGLVHTDLTPKPSYTGIQNLIKMLADSGSPRRDEVALSVDAPSSVHHLLLEKSNGRRYLAIWNEVTSSGTGDGDLPMAHIVLDGAHPEIDGFDATGALTHGTLPTQNGSFTYPVKDSISIVEWSAAKP